MTQCKVGRATTRNDTLILTSLVRVAALSWSEFLGAARGVSVVVAGDAITTQTPR